MFNYGVLEVVLVGTAILGILSGIIGVFTLLKQQALIGDVLSHATLPGVVLMFIFTSSRNISILLIGAAISAYVAMTLLNVIKKYSNISSEALMALILSSFFGFGHFLMSLIARNPIYAGANLNSFIFGNAATLIEADVMVLIVVGIVVVGLMMFFWRHFKLHTFNATYYESLGFSTRLIDFVMTFMTILVIVVGIRTVGVILMSALLIVPGLAARQLSDRLFMNIFIAGFIGGLSAVTGSFLSVTYGTGIPTGPSIVIVGTSIALAAILFAPKKGFVSKEIKRFIQKRQIKVYKLLIHIYENNIVSINGLDEIDKLTFEQYKEHAYIASSKDGIYVTSKGITKIESIIGGKSL